MLCVKNCIVAARRGFKDVGRTVPIMVQMSFDQDNGNQTLTGSDPSVTDYVLEVPARCLKEPFRNR